MSSSEQHPSFLKRNCGLIYSSESDDCDGPVRIKRKLRSPSKTVVSDKEEYIIPSLPISPRPMSPVENFDDEVYIIPTTSASPCPSSAFPRDKGDTLSDILQDAGIPYFHVGFSDIDMDNESYRNYYDTSSGKAHDNASCNSEMSTIDVDEKIVVDDIYIDHESADLEITPKELHDLVSSPDFDFAEAKKLIHTSYAFDWATKSLSFEQGPRIGIEEAEKAYDKWEVQHFIDYTSVEGSPLKPVSASKSHLDTVRFSFNQWSISYRNKLCSLVQNGQEFTTFRFASVGRLHYYMIFPQPMEPCDGQPKPKCRPLGHKSLARERALELSAFMIKIFSSVRELKACGINKETWSGLGKKSHDLDHKNFEIFQRELFARWKDEFVAGHEIGYWTTVLPEIHVYSYGTNQAISYDSRNPRDSLDAITEDLKRLYDPSTISTLSFALATEVSLIQVDPSIDGGDGQGKCHPRALLAATEEVYNQYNGQKASRSGLRTFPVLLSPKACNFQSATLPEFYRKLIRSIVIEIEEDNDKINSAAPPLDFVSFQGYSFFQKQVHSDFRLGETNYVAAHCFPEGDLGGVNLNRLRKLRNDTVIHRPIAIVNEGLAVLGSGDPIPFRFEPVVTISLRALDKDHRTFEYIVDNILKPLLDLWHGNHAWICTRLLLPFDVSVSPFSLAYLLVRSEPYVQCGC